MKKNIFLILIILCFFLLLFIHSCRKNNTGKYLWKDGFLEKDYASNMTIIDDAEFQLSNKWLSLRLILIDDGYTRIYGVGNEEGIFSSSEKKGGTVQIKVIKKEDNLTSVGIKVGEGDRKASELLHVRFNKILTELK